MQRTILVVLIVLVIAKPFFAQLVEPDGLFSMEGTRWGYCGTGPVSNFPFIGGGCFSLDFYEGTVYWCAGENSCKARPGWSYYDYLAVSILAGTYSIESSNPNWSTIVASMQLIGIGIFTEFGEDPGGLGNPGYSYYIIGISRNCTSRFRSFEYHL